MLVLLWLTRWQQSSFVAPASGGHRFHQLWSMSKKNPYPSIPSDFVVDGLEQMNSCLTAAFLTCPRPALPGSSKDATATVIFHNTSVLKKVLLILTQGWLHFQ